MINAAQQFLVAAINASAIAHQYFMDRLLV
jgi:hypothetical protein